MGRYCNLIPGDTITDPGAPTDYSEDGTQDVLEVTMGGGFPGFYTCYVSDSYGSTTTTAAQDPPPPVVDYYKPTAAMSLRDFSLQRSKNSKNSKNKLLRTLS